MQEKKEEKKFRENAASMTAQRGEEGRAFRNRGALRFFRVRRILSRIAVVLACVVVFVTTYALLLPAITLERSAAQKMPGFRLETDHPGIDRPQTPSGQDLRYVLVGKSIEKKVLASDGRNYRVRVTFGPEAGIPEGTELSVREILPDTNDRAESEAYEEYMSETMEALGWEDRTASYVRLFDITLVDDRGIEVQPAEGSKVSVEIRLDDKEEETEPQVVHIGDSTEVLAADTQGDTVSFETESFSVYAIVDAPEPVKVEEKQAQTTEELAENTSEAFYLSLKRSGKTWYFTDILNSKGVFEEKENVSEAAAWFFEPVEGQTDAFYLATYVTDAASGTQKKQYVINPKDNNVGFSDDPGAVLEISNAADGLFYMKMKGQNKWLQHSNGGGGIRFYTDKNNAENTRIMLSYVSSFSSEKDPYDLDGTSWGIAYHNDTAAAAALMASAKDDKHLTATDLLMRPDVLDNEGILLVAADSEITQWTFHSVEEDKYRLSAVVDGKDKYLALNSQALTLADSQEEASLFTVTPGTGTNAGKYRLTADRYSIEINLSGNDTGNGFWGTTSTGASTWLNLVEKSVLGDEDFHLYSARKVSASDSVTLRDDGQVILYTRLWNETTSRYEFYAVDYDGTLVRCYDTGDGIEWIGSRVNTALWTFTEYHNIDGTPNYYYELQNVQYRNYIAPQVTGGQVMASGPIGINLNGRRYGESYSTVIAWDEANYAYAGLKTENGRVVSCPLSEAEDFYFALVKTAGDSGQNELTTVETIDNTDYGIKMKMIDFNNTIKGDRDSVQHAFFGSHSNAHETGLLSTSLTDGYPTTTSKTGHEAPLSDLFKDADMQDANHLFIRSIYNESGYFEYDSTSNFARLNGDGNFTVYDQIAAIGTSVGTTRTHGQFMPYNDIEAGKYAYDDKGNPITNQTNVLAQELSDLDPRKGERLYSIPQKEADYYFGMEMSAGFTQTASGVDAWGHDIIFEFSGDDDFWLYVDGELVLDLGGVRSALTGTVNFRTGEVVAAGKKTTLYETFKSNYQARGLSSKEISEKLEEIFVKNEEGAYVFRDYTNHTMRMFYMERGAGASNLHMRFNLAAVKPGTVTLSKKLSGTESASNSLIEFPYQIYYTTRDDGGDMVHLLGEDPGEQDLVTYRGTGTPVRYSGSFTPAGGSKAYEHVFFLKPGETAVIDLPDWILDYTIVECGVNPQVYDRVTANGTLLKGSDSGNPGRKDYRTEAASMEDRPEVEFDNHISDGAMRTLSVSKKLYDVDGKTVLQYPDDQTLFSFRLYLGDENADPSALPYANLYSYFVKDGNGNYCSWDADIQRFVSLGFGDYSRLARYLEGMSPADREAVIFTTSMNGSISRIPAGYTVEVRDLIIGTQFMVEEREDEIPRGYTLRLGDGYTRVDIDPEEEYGTTPVIGTMTAEMDPVIEVRNQKGWGLTVEKVWTDADFMDQHAPIYFAVYLADGMGNPGDLVEGSVRQLRPGDTQIYYFFDHLTPGRKFSDYLVREVTVEAAAGENLSIDSSGGVYGYDPSTVHPIEEGGSLETGGQPAGGSYSDSGFTYQVAYVKGTQTSHNENVRVDTAINSRPGIELYKKDLDGRPLAGAVFTLRDEQGKDVAAQTYTSDETGLITIAYLPAGTYTLTETEAPRGYVVMDAPLEIRVEADGTIQVGADDDIVLEADDANAEMSATIAIKDRPSALQVKKIDADTGEPVEGTHFALYPQVTDNEGKKVKDYLPLKTNTMDYADLITDSNGVLNDVTMDLGTGVYYLTETKAAEGYDLLREDLCFGIGSDGTVTIYDLENQSGGTGTASGGDPQEETGTKAASGAEQTGTASGAEQQNWLTQSTDPVTGGVSFTISVPNSKMKRLRLRKAETGNSTHLLAGASFVLYRTEDFDDRTGSPESGAVPVAQGTTGEDGLLALGEIPFGEYRLVETEAPDGYLLPETPLHVRVNTAVTVTTSQGSALNQVTESVQDDTWEILVLNTAGYELPSTGGPGTHLFYILGGLLTILAGCFLLPRRHR